MPKDGLCEVRSGGGGGGGGGVPISRIGCLRRRHSKRGRAEEGVAVSAIPHPSAGALSEGTFGAPAN